MKYRHFFIILGAFGLLVLGNRSVEAATFTVSNLNDAGAGSLRQAILNANAAPGADLIVCRTGLTGTIHLLPGSGQLEIAGDLTIQGPGAATLAVSGSADVIDDSTAGTRVIAVERLAKVTMSGLTITRGSVGVGEGGGGMSNAGDLTLNRCTLSGNRAGFGGGLLNQAGAAAKLSGCNLSQNRANGLGGGILNAGAMTLNGCNFVGNRAAFAGGLFNERGGTVHLTDAILSGNSASLGGGGINNGGGGLTLFRCTLSGNSAESAGGGIVNAGGGVATLTACTVFANFGGTAGGGIYNQSGTMTVRNSSVAGNGVGEGGGGTHFGWGGGIINEGGAMEVQNSVINGNLANEGGGIFNSSNAEHAMLTVSNSTLSGNRAAERGGGIFNTSRVRMTHCTLFGNRAEVGGGVQNTPSGQMEVGNTLAANSGAGRNYVVSGEHSLLTSTGYNLDSDGSGGFDQPGDQSGTLETPLDPKVGPLQNNGGPTATHALLPGSPAVDRGDPALSPGGTEPRDQRGFPRFADGDGDGTAVIDIGAYELSFFGSRDLGGPPRQGFLTFSTVETQNTALFADTAGFNLTIHYSADLSPQTLVATLNGQDITPAFNPATPERFETVRIPLREGPNRLVLRVKGARGGKPAQEVETLGFWVGEPPYGPR